MNNLSLEEIAEVLEFINNKYGGQFENMSFDDKSIFKMFMGEFRVRLVDKQKEIRDYLIENDELFKSWESYDNVPVRIKLLNEVTKGIKLKDGYEFRLH